MMVTARRVSGSKQADAGGPRLPVLFSIFAVRTRIRLLLSLITIALLGGAAACAESTAGPVAGRVETEIVGRWVSNSDELSPEAWHQSSLTFTIDGRYTFESRTYGLYEGQDRDALSALRRTEGRYRIAGDRLLFEPQRVVWWDHFEGEHAALHEEAPSWGHLFDDATFTVDGDRFTMRYSIAPANAIIEAIAEYARER